VCLTADFKKLSSVHGTWYDDRGITSLSTFVLGCSAKMMAVLCARTLFAERRRRKVCMYMAVCVKLAINCNMVTDECST
jgi:hypothetical protein